MMTLAEAGPWILTVTSVGEARAVRIKQDGEQHAREFLWKVNRVVRRYPVLVRRFKLIGASLQVPQIDRRLICFPEMREAK